MAVCSGVARAPSFAFPRVSGARTTTGRARACRCRASDSEDGVARVRVFTGGRKEALFGARENMLSLLERGATDDAAIEAAIEELSGMNPTEAPARDPKLIGTWRLMWSKQAETANPFQRAFGALAKDNFQILNADDTLENLVRLGPLTVSARAGESHLGYPRRGQHLHHRYQPLRKRRQDHADDSQTRPRRRVRRAALPRRRPSGLARKQRIRLCASPRGRGLSRRRGDDGGERDAENHHQLGRD